MNTENITKGEFHSGQNGRDTYVSLKNGGRAREATICKVSKRSGTEEQKANADLIEEAFVIANETGKSPKHLSDLVKEMAAWMKNMSNYVSDHIEELHNENAPLQIIAQSEILYEKATK